MVPAGICPEVQGNKSPVHIGLFLAKLTETVGTLTVSSHVRTAREPFLSDKLPESSG